MGWLSRLSWRKIRRGLSTLSICSARLALGTIWTPDRGRSYLRPAGGPTPALVASGCKSDSQQYERRPRGWSGARVATSEEREPGIESSSGHWEKPMTSGGPSHEFWVPSLTPNPMASCRMGGIPTRGNLKLASGFQLHVRSFLTFAHHDFSLSHYVYENTPVRCLAGRFAYVYENARFTLNFGCYL
jgi:hypothetical protein